MDILKEFSSIKEVIKSTLVKKVAFISGHRDITEAEFTRHYVPKIMDAIENKHKFVVGDYIGADTFAQKYLKDILDAGLISKNDVTVCYMYDKPMNYISPFKRKGWFYDDFDRDGYMTTHSDYDITWIRPSKMGQNSGSEQNIIRRKNVKKVERLKREMYV